MLGLPKDTVKLVAHNKEWVNCFEEEKRQMTIGIGDHIVDVHHFGSTAVAGLDAKPIIDIVISVIALDDVGKCANYLAEIGYERHPEIIVGGSIFFTKGDPTTHHLHFTEQDDESLKKWLFFRDQLRENDRLAEEYRQLKRVLEKHFAKDRKAYNQGKDAFINDVLKEMK